MFVELLCVIWYLLFVENKYKNRYRIPSNRLWYWDYSNSGCYFITLVTHNREHVFGEVVDRKMVLSEFGKIAHAQLLKSFEIRKELLLDEFIIMPNHIHAIVILNKETAIKIDGCHETHDHGETHGRHETHDYHETHGRASLSCGIACRKPKSISTFVAGYKSAVLNSIDNYIDSNRLENQKFNSKNPLWQSNYYDHIIRNNRAYVKIKKYIVLNPEKWV